MFCCTKSKSDLFSAIMVGTFFGGGIRSCCFLCGTSVFTLFSFTSLHVIVTKRTSQLKLALIVLVQQRGSFEKSLKTLFFVVDTFCGVCSLFLLRVDVILKCISRDCDAFVPYPLHGGTSISKILNTTLVLNQIIGTASYLRRKSVFVYLKSFLWSYSSGRAIPNEDNVVFSSGSGKTACPHAVKSNG